MTKWRVQYKSPKGTLEQTAIEVDGEKTANDVRTMIVNGETTLYVRASDLVLVEKMEGGQRL